MVSIGKFAGRAADMAAGAVGDIMGSDAYPDTRYGLAAYLFDQIVQAEKELPGRNRAYYLDLMRQCLAVASEAEAPETPPAD